MDIVNFILTGYQTLDRIYEGNRTLVYRGTRLCDKRPVAIKVLHSEYPSFSELVQFRNQYTIAKNLNLPGIIETYSLEAYQNSYALVMEDFGGISLKHWMEQGETPLNLIDFLQMAIDISNTLDILSRHRIIHKDIKPANILINPQTKQIKLIDFSIASLLPRETQTLINPNVLEGTLAYISPEQTGRMNRGVDYRTDFYSLGVTLYELLAGELPFQSHDAMELVHSHIAKQPPSLHEINPQIPQVVSSIVSKLMAKNAEDRYQSALGLKFDLEVCLRQLQESGKIEGFEIGQRDLCDRFIIPEKLYGRETEVSTLLQAFERVSQGATEMMLVAGFSGIGKTAVVKEVHKPIVRQRGYFIKGKFDQFNRNIPFSAFVQAFRDLMGQLLSESDRELHIWKTQILQALGDSGQVIIEVIPELERIVGKQAPATELSGTAAQNRFNLLFQKFIQVFTTKEHPLVMFLDDLQWADSASLNLIQLSMNESESHYLLIIGAYRNNEVSPGHPLMLTLDAVAKANATINTITLHPLSQSSLNQLVADTLNCHILTAQPLTEQIALKTKGNPFFATQFLKALYLDGLIQFDPPQSLLSKGGRQGWWKCDIAQIKALAVTDDVVEFMASQLQKLPNNTQDILKLAACIGAQFDLNTLAIVSQQSESDAAVALWKALQSGLIIPQSEIYKFYVGELDTTQNPQQEQVSLNYKFLHDRVQQAAYSLIPDDQKQITHLTIGRLLLQSTSPTDLDTNIFEIVGHWNQAIEVISNATEIERLIGLNLLAGRKAKASAAYPAVLNYLQVGLGLLNQAAWNIQYDLALQLHENAAEAAYLNGEFELAEQLITTVLEEARSHLDRVTVYEVQIASYMAQSRLADALQTGRSILKLLGIVLPEAPTLEDVQCELASTAAAMNQKSLTDLAQLPQMQDTTSCAAIRILKGISPPAFQSAPLLFPFVVCKMLQLTIEQGNSPNAAISYSFYGVLLLNVFQNFESAYEYGQLSCQLDLAPDTGDRVTATFMSGSCLFHIKVHLREALPFLLRAYQAGLENGDFQVGGYALMNRAQYLYFVGEDLTQLQQEMATASHVFTTAKQGNTLLWTQTFAQAVLNLLGQSAHPCRLVGTAYDETQAIPLQLAANDRTGLHYIYLNKLILDYLFGEYQSASDNAAIAESYLDGVVGFFDGYIFRFYDSLIQLALADGARKPMLATILEKVQANQAQMHLWASHAPMNFQHKYDLVEAEYQKVLGHKTEAIELYDRAISGAKANEYIQEEALANELAAKFYLNWGKEKVAAGYMQEAYYCYAKWGAKAKTDDLEQCYPDLLRPILQQFDPSVTILDTLATLATSAYSSHSTTHKNSSSSSINTTLDFAAILKASQALSGSIQLEDLLYQLTQIILQNSGGDRCALILPSENQVWEVRAIATPTATELCSELLENNLNVPVKLIQYVKNTQQVVMIDNLETDLPVIGNYLRQQQPKSVLCLPILNQGHLVGILYLKNGLTSGVFTSERIAILDFLCTQAAISLENARLYNQVQQTLTDLQKAQLKIVQSEKMSALGNLVAGVAHEINNPVGCIIGNVGAVQDSINDLFGLIDLYNDKFPQPGTEIEEELETIDLEYLRDDLPKLIRAMKDGGDRIRGISTSLRTFSRADKDYKVPFNIHEGIDSTILILKHRLKANEHRPQIEVVTDYGNLPKIECFPGQLNQVFMNLLANAIDALEDSSQGRSFEEIEANPNCITVRSGLEGDRHIKITIADNGAGMTESVKQQIFDHLFTTKAVGKGTGLGLAIAKQIVVEKHGGLITVNSTLGKGTTFVLELPIIKN